MKTFLAVAAILFAVAICFLMTSGCRTFHMEGTVDTTEATGLPMLP